MLVHGRSVCLAPRTAPRPAPVHQAPPPAPAQSGGGSMLGGIGSTIAHGMGLGTGSAVAHRAMDAIMGPQTIDVVGKDAAAAPVPPANSMDACNIQSEAFQDCINSYGSDISRCQFYMDMLAECRKNNGAPMSA
ncbi:hypothetical protein AAHE18_10G043300 [Arachis hypogaea]|nr:uncharacterized protein DS421_10g291900 [Arachis hypogaea]